MDRKRNLLGVDGPPQLFTLLNRISLPHGWKIKRAIFELIARKMDFSKSLE